jgi:exodeoxyribonuclease-3
MKIASWNINSVRFRIDIVLRFLAEAAPDVLCLQETKVVDADFPADNFRAAGYPHLVVHGQRVHHGVAIVSRVPVAEDDRLDWQACACRTASGWRMCTSPRAATSPTAT